MIRYYIEEDSSFLDITLEFFKVKLSSLKNNPFSKILVYDDGVKKGMLAFSLYYDRAELDYIYVCPEFRKHGVAQDLMNFMIKECFNAQNITLEVDEKNVSAINLYKKLGFDIVATREKYYNNGNSAYLMERKL